ncbi:MAG: alpha/beta hydrolase [Gemmatimonadaceae bacterium]|nr:alpha/beta hydrolase [Gemmatimonadaceae bacterium]
MPPIPPPRESGFTTTTPVPLYWCRYGPVGAPPLLVLHGGPGAHHDYLLPQLLTLAEEYDCLFYDQRGGGRSRHDDDRADITWQSQAADVAAVCREFALERPVVVGYSWGALLAMLTATEAAAGRLAPRPAALALIDPAPISRAFRTTFEQEFAARSQSEAVRALRTALATSGLKERDPGAYKQRAFELSVAGYFADPAASHGLTPFRVTERVQRGVWDSLGDYDLTEALTALRDTPSLIVHGRQDPIPLASSEAAAAAMGAALVALDACGHVPYVEQPSALFAPLVAFLHRVLPPG